MLDVGGGFMAWILCCCCCILLSNSQEPELTVLHLQLMLSLCTCVYVTYILCIMYAHIPLELLSNIGGFFPSFCFRQ